MITIEPCPYTASVHRFDTHSVRLGAHDEETLRLCSHCGLTHRLVVGKDTTDNEILEWELVPTVRSAAGE